MLRPRGESPGGLSDYVACLRQLLILSCMETMKKARWIENEVAIEQLQEIKLPFNPRFFGGGVYPMIIWVGVCCLDPRTRSLYQS